MKRGCEQPEPEATRYDRASQYLAIPLSGLVPVHSHRAPHVSYWRRRSTAIMTWCALVASTLGAWLAVAAPPSQVYEDAAGVHIGPALLAARSSSPLPGYAYFSGGASLLLRDDAGIEKASAAAVVNGQRAAGVCLLNAAARGAFVESCSFIVGGHRLTSSDVYDPHRHRWLRTYSDGVTAEFLVPPGGSVLPIPLPLGH